MIHWLIVHYDRATIDNAQRNVLCTVFRVARFSSFSFFSSLLHVHSIYLMLTLSHRHSFSQSRSLYSVLSHSFGYQTTYASVGRRFVTTLFNVHNKLSAPHSVNVLVYIACEWAKMSECVCVCVLYSTHIPLIWCECCKSQKKIPTHNRPVPWCYCSYIHDIIVYTRTVYQVAVEFVSILYGVYTVHRGLLLSFSFTSSVMYTNTNAYPHS